MSLNVHINMLDSLNDKEARPPDHPHLDMMQEAINSPREILAEAGIPHQVYTFDHRDVRRLDPYSSHFAACISLSGPGQGTSMIVRMDLAP